MKLSEVTATLEAIAPLAHAEAWDNVGLIAGDAKQDVSRAMLTIDLTSAVAAEAKENRCDLIIAYHPPIFSGIKQLTAGHVVFDAICRGVAIYSPHTAWDAAAGGAHDFLADVLEMGERSALRLNPVKADHHKLVTFLPESSVEKVSDALFAAGAGKIGGNYSSCSFRTPGTGTFFGEAGAKPAVGESGKLEAVPEVRLETVVPIAQTDSVLRALRTAHPYEEPAFDLSLLAAATTGVGQGRIGTIAPTARAVIFDRLKRQLGLKHLLIAGPMAGDVRSIACCAGAGGELLEDAISQKAEMYVTGELRHHDVLRAVAAGMTVVCTLHTNSERASLTRLRDRLSEKLPGLAIHLSAMDRDPLSVQ